MVERVLAQTSVASTDMGAFGQGQSVSDTTLMEMIASAGTLRALVVVLGGGDQWWSTRLFLLSCLLHTRTSVRQLIFCPNGRFVGMASPAAVIDGLSSNFPLLDEFNHRLRATLRDAARLAWAGAYRPIHPAGGNRPRVLTEIADGRFRSSGK